MIDQWITLLDGIAVSPMDRETIDSFRKSPNSRIFLAISDILSRHNQDDEALQLLIYGVQHHPSYTAARVVLAQKLFERSVFSESWQLLEQSPINLRENKTAQILRFRLALLLGYEERLIALRREMKASSQLEGAIARLSEELDLKPFHLVRSSFLQVAKAEGFNIDKLEPCKGVCFEHMDTKSENVETEGKPSESKDDGLDPVLLDRLIDGFYVAPISQIFHKTEENDIPEEDHHNLDAVSLAQVYRKQARYQKALDIYRKLLYMAPNNDLYKKQVEELSSLRDEQRLSEKNFDPELVERMDQVQIIENKIGFLSRLLARLDNYESS